MAIQTDIVIVGGAMAGATLALALAKNTQWRVTLVAGNSHEPRKALLDSKRKVPESRVVALNAASLEFLETLDVPPESSDFACDYHEMVVWDGEGTGEVVFKAADRHVQKLGVIAENIHLVSLIRERLKGQSSVQVIADDSVVELSGEAEGAKVIRLASGERIKAGLVVAADGASSFMREAAGIDVDARAYGHCAIVATVEVSNPHGGVAYQRFSADGPLAFLPLPSIEGKHYCSVVWSLKDEVASARNKMNHQEFTVLLERAIEGRLGQVLDIYHRAIIPLVERHAQEYFKAGVVLIGDAAHTLHPLAGQGVNLGFADVAVLADELTRAECRGLNIQDQSILARYQRRRKLHNAAAIKAMSFFKVCFENQSPYFGLLRNKGMNIFNNSAWLKRQAMDFASGLI